MKDLSLQSLAVELCTRALTVAPLDVGFMTVKRQTPEKVVPGRAPR
jgi:hypothetical protein